MNSVASAIWWGQCIIQKCCGAVFNPDLQALSEGLAAAVNSGNWSNYSPNKRFYDSMTAQTIIALVAFLLKAATVLAVENGLTGADEATTLLFGTRCGP
jgi:hypothetical protein